ncbi:hypothetical protein PVBG_00617 [Plasmodium vivax Brazil I]|uniref:Uncharacterized protein n=2 Tax=Plasmodium vivax TaxID=5855 RepID=A0A0J9TLK5_PLAVI|nr:hypothetical protein PVBG_00617 [Plasmodium vivax Brazil I]KMZ95991.1 hypothetical protein PVNG_02840 [Plasmodium vivax North Korean]
MNIFMKHNKRLNYGINLLQENDIEILTSYKIYKVFNRTRRQILDKNKCDELKRKLSKTDNISEFCYILHENIKEVSDTTAGTTKNNSYCEFLNYWLYYSLFKNDLLDNTNNIAESEFIKHLDELWKDADNNNMCDLTKYDMNIKYFMYTKELYDYSKNYDNIYKIKDNQDTDLCRKYYCSYIENAKKIYNSLMLDCFSEKNKPYCNMFNEITTDKNPNTLFDQFRCSKEHVDESLLEVENIFGLIPQSILNDIGDNDLRLPAPRSPPRDSKDTLDGESPNPSRQDSPDNQQEDPSSNSSVKVGLSTFGMSLVPLFLMYKVKINVYFIIFTFIMNQLFSIKEIRQKMYITFLFPF